MQGLGLLLGRVGSQHTWDSLQTTDLVIQSLDTALGAPPGEARARVGALGEWALPGDGQSQANCPGYTRSMGPG